MNKSRTMQVVRGGAQAALYPPRVWDRAGSERLDVLGQSPPLLRRELRPDDAVALSVIEFMAGIVVAAHRGIELESAVKLVKTVADVDGIVFAVAEPEFGGPLRNRRQQRIDIWNRTVVEVWRRRPNAVQWARLVRQQGLNAVPAIPVHPVSVRIQYRRLLPVIPIVHGLLDELTERGPKFA